MCWDKHIGKSKRKCKSRNIEHNYGKKVRSETYKRIIYVIHPILNMLKKHENNHSSIVSWSSLIIFSLVGIWRQNNQCNCLSLQFGDNVISGTQRLPHIKSLKNFTSYLTSR